MRGSWNIFELSTYILSSLRGFRHESKMDKYIRVLFYLIL